MDLKKPRSLGRADWCLELVKLVPAFLFVVLQYLHSFASSTEFGDSHNLTELLDGYPSSAAYVQLTQALDVVHLSSGVTLPLREANRMAVTRTVAPFGTQVLALLLRQARVTFFDPLNYPLRLALSMVIVVWTASVQLLLGTRDSARINSYAAYLSGILMFLCLCGLIAIPQRILQRQEAIHQRSNAMYHAASYLLSNFIVDVFVLFLFGCAVLSVRLILTHISRHSVLYSHAAVSGL